MADRDITTGNPAVTPGAVNPAAPQEAIGSTICWLAERGTT